MAHRNMVCTPQVIDLESEQGHVQVHPENFYYRGNGTNLPNQDMQFAVRVAGNATNVGLCNLRSHYERMNQQQQHVQNSHPHLGAGSGFIFTSTMYNPCLSTSVNRFVPHTQSFGLGNPLPLPLNHQVVTGSMGESGSNDNVGESARGFIKRKNAEVVAGGCHFVHGFASSSSSSSHASQNSACRLWDASFESNGLPNAAAFSPPEYHGHGGWSSLEGSSVNGTNGFNSMTIQPELAHHGNYIFPTSHMSQCFQPTSGIWIAQTANGVADGVPQWEHINAGRFVHSGATELADGGLQEYRSGPSAICHGPLPYFHHHPLHSTQANNLVDQTQMQAPYQQCINNSVVHGGVNPSANGLHLDPRTLAFSTNSEYSFGPPQHPYPTSQVNHGSVRILPYEHATMINLPRLYEVANSIDEHIDMRLDIDSMSYEELLALEEQIGDVNTGLAESYILGHLKTTLYMPGTHWLSDQPSESSVENDACIICQEEYEAKERIGTLDCGHKYHAKCIKQWLMVKNLCPICKTTALSADRRNG